jgi:hypothetical protein
MIKKHRVKVTEAQLDAAIAQSARKENLDKTVVRANYDQGRDRLLLELSDGIEIAIPRRRLQGLTEATPDVIARVEVLDGGNSLHWPGIDVDHYVPGLLDGVFGTRDWMARLGRRGGSKQTAAKAAAARRNGLKGGRPRKAISNVAAGGYGFASSDVVGFYRVFSSPQHTPNAAWCSISPSIQTSTPTTGTSRAA